MHLEQHDYVVRTPDPTDRRAKLVIPTAKGHAGLRSSCASWCPRSSRTSTSSWAHAGPPPSGRTWRRSAQQSRSPPEVRSDSRHRRDGGAETERAERMDPEPEVHVAGVRRRPARSATGQVGPDEAPRARLRPDPRPLQDGRLHRRAEPGRRSRRSRSGRPAARRSRPRHRRRLDCHSGLSVRVRQVVEGHVGGDREPDACPPRCHAGISKVRPVSSS